MDINKPEGMLGSQSSNSFDPGHAAQCKACDRPAVVEDPPGKFYCRDHHTLFSFTRKDYWSHPEAKGYPDKR